MWDFGSQIDLNHDCGALCHMVYFSNLATLKMEEAGSSEMLILFYQITWQHILSCNRSESITYKLTDELNSIS
jgi:hypothetical protein